MSKLLYITGCARSGTTLLRRMFYAYSGEQVYIVDTECSPAVAIAEAQQHSAELVVVKRDFRSIGAGLVNSVTEMHRQIKMLDENQALVFPCMRDGRDVIESRVVRPMRWCQAMLELQLIGTLAPGRLLGGAVDFARMLEHPGRLQNEVETLLEMRSGIELRAPKESWSRYPEFLPPGRVEDTPAGDAAYRDRPLDASRALTPRSFWRERENVGARDYWSMMHWLAHMGYVDSDLGSD